MTLRGQGLSALMLGAAIVFASACTKTPDTDDTDDTDVTNADVDGDGFNADVDCDDTDAAINPDAEEILDNNVDEDCDGVKGETPAQTLAGSSTYKFTYDDVNVCDLDIDFTGEEYAGGCIDCDFAFTMSATIADDRSEASDMDCIPLTWLSFIPSAPYIANVALFHYPTFDYYGIDNALMVGTALDATAYGGSYYEGPYFGSYGGGIISFESDTYPSNGTYSRTGDDLEWTFHFDGTESILTFEETCPEDYTGYLPFSDTYDTDPAVSDGKGGGTAMAEDVPCDGELADAWTFTGSGADVEITVDTVDAASSVDLIVYVNGPATADDDSTCDGTIHMADDSYDCAFVPPSGYKCPSLAFPAEKGGEYTVYLMGTNATDLDDATIHTDCDVVTTAKYTIKIAEGTTDVKTTLADDVAARTDHPYSYDVTATAKISGAQ